MFDVYVSGWIQIASVGQFTEASGGPDTCHQRFGICQSRRNVSSSIFKWHDLHYSIYDNL